MSILDSRRRPARRLLSGLIILSATAWMFYLIQNSAAGRGGNIAPVKALWLLTVIVFWYLLPLVWALDRTLSARARTTCWLFAGNMLLRAVVELWLMYGSQMWQHSYGIGHDIASILLCLALAFYLRRGEVWLWVFFVYCAVLFAFETLFALYLRGVTNADGRVFFLPSSETHTAILNTTGTVVAVSVIVGSGLIWKWMNGASSIASSDA